MAPFFSRIVGKDRSASTSSPSAAEIFKAQHSGPAVPESAASHSTSSSPSQISSSSNSHSTAPRVVLTSASPITEDSSSRITPETNSTDGNSSLKKRQTLASIPIPPLPTTLAQAEPDLSDVATPTAPHNGLKNGYLPPPELVVQDDEEQTAQGTQFEAQDLPSRRSSIASISLRRKGSKAAMKDSTTSSAAPPQAQAGVVKNSQPSRSRQGSVASSEAGSLHRNDTITPSGIAENGSAAPSTTNSVSLARTPSAPSSGLLSAPTLDGDAVSIRSGKKKRLWSNAGEKKKGGPPAGGIAGALAQSGMSLAGMASPPLPQSSPPRRAASKSSHVPRSSIDSVLHPRRGSTAGWHGGHNGHASQSGDEYHEDPDDVYDSPDALSFEDDEMPVTGFAVASSRRNNEFHELFPGIEEGDYLIEDYGCAMQRDILVQGRLYISENHMCFHANIFGWVTNVTIAFAEVVALEKKMTAFVIPNAIQVATRKTKYTFASFITRDTSYEVIHNIWNMSHPHRNRSSDDAEATANGGTSPDGTPLEPDGGLIGAGANGGANPLSKKAPTHCACGKKGEHYDMVMMDCLMPGTPAQIHTLMWTSAFIKDFMVNNQKLTDIQTSDWAPATKGSNLLSRNLSYTKPLSNSLGPKSTKCEIIDETVHADFDDYISILTTTKTPNVPSGNAFSVKTRTCLMWGGPAVTKIVVTSKIEWTGRSYIKSLIEKGANDGQRSWHADLEVAMRAYVNAHKNEFFPDGLDEGDVPDDPHPDLPTPIGTGGADPELTTDELKRAKQRATEQKSLQWALDTFTGTWNVAERSVKGAIDILGDVFEQSSPTGILVLIVVVLVASNAWTLMNLKSAQKIQAEQRYQMRMASGAAGGNWFPPQAPQPASNAPATGAPPPPTSAEIELKALLESLLLANRAPPPPPAPVIVELPPTPKEEFQSIQDSITALEERIQKLKASVADNLQLD